jgi:hypothetical protein
VSRIAQILILEPRILRSVEEDGSFRFEKTEVVAVLASICLEQSRHDLQ